MGQVNVIFHGICTHFIGVVPGVPHRVVLPDSSALQLGIVIVDGSEGTFFLMPHFPILRLESTAVQNSLNVPGAIERGNIIDGVRLQIANPAHVGNQYDPTFAIVPHLTEFVDHYVYSDEVVTGGRAGVYFDLFSAVLTSAATEPSGAIDVVATIETLGAPELLVTTFADGQPNRFPLTNDPDGVVDLWVANQGMDCDTPMNSFDFLLHYLTARTGIPRRLRQPTPGMATPVGVVSHEVFNAGADTLKTLDYPNRFDAPCFSLEKIQNPIYITSIACANSQYP